MTHPIGYPSTNPTPLDDAELDRLEVLSKAATSGPLELAEPEWALSELGKSKGMRPQKLYVPRATWNHGQAMAPLEIAMTASSPYFEPNHVAYIHKEDAEYLVAAWNAVPALIAEVRRLRTLLSHGGHTPEVAAKLNKLRNAVDADAYDDARSLIAEIRAEAGEDYPECMYYEQLLPPEYRR